MIDLHNTAPYHTIPYMEDIGSMGGWLVDGKDMIVKRTNDAIRINTYVNL